MARCACCNAPISRLTEAVCWRCREILDRKIDGIVAGLAADPPMPPQRVRFGPGALPVTEGWYQRRRREAEAYYDGMQHDISSSYVWPARECACGELISGPLDQCRLCRMRHRNDLEFEEANDQVGD